MNLPNGQLNFGLDFNFDIKIQEKTKTNGFKKLYKVKVAKRFEHIIFKIFISEVTNNLYFG